MALLLLVSCSSAPPMVAREHCSMDDLDVEVEVGNPTPCQQALTTLAWYRALYEERFGRQGLWGRPVRFRASDDLGDRAAGRTYPDAIDLGSQHLGAFPHELNHVRTGPTHNGWCRDFDPWSRQVLGQGTNLGCQ